MIDDKGGDFEKFRMSDEQMKGMSRKVRHFYETQNEILVSPCLSHLGLATNDRVGAVQDGFREVDEILDNTRAMAATGELAPMIPVRQASCEPPCSGTQLTSLYSQTKPSAGREEAFNLKVKLAINVNFLIVRSVSPLVRGGGADSIVRGDSQNFILLGSKIAIVLISSSMSLIASTVDSAMDFLSVSRIRAGGQQGGLLMSCFPPDPAICHPHRH